MTYNSRYIYPYVTLESEEGYAKKVYMHKLVALAYVDYEGSKEYYEVIHHKDDDRTNYSKDNLEFTTFDTNMQYAIDNGRFKKEEGVYLLYMKNGSQFKGTIKELVDLTGIPKNTLYDNIYTKRESRKIHRIEKVS